MLSALKRKLEAKKQTVKAIAESRHWKHHQQLQTCLQAMRGCCTVVPMDLHEAIASVVNIALQEDTWTAAERIPCGFLPETVYIIWNHEHLPVMRADSRILLNNLEYATAVASDTYLVSDTMDRIVRFCHGIILLYDLTD